MGVYRRVLTCKSSITYLALSVPVDGEIQSGYKNGRKRGQNPLKSVSKGMKKACCKARCTNGLWRIVTITSFANAAYLHHWLSVTIHFNRYNLRFNKYTECRDKCKSLYFIALHIRVVPFLFNSFVECPLSDTMYWAIGHFRRYVTGRLLNTKVVLFLGFRWLAVWFLFLEGGSMAENCS